MAPVAYWLGRRAHEVHFAITCVTHHAKVWCGAVPPPPAVGSAHIALPEPPENFACPAVLSPAVCPVVNAAACGAAASCPAVCPALGLDRFVLLPIQQHGLWGLYKQALANFWTVDEIVMEKDVIQFTQQLTGGQRALLSNTLAFFACADGIVGENLAARFLSDVDIPESRMFYAVQILQEAVHEETYSVLIDTLYRDPQEKEELFHRFQAQQSAVGHKAQFALEYITDRKVTFPERLVAFLIVEGIFFSASFASIFYFKHLGLLLGVVFANELIIRDEGDHCRHCVELFQVLGRPLGQARVQELVRAGVQVEERFVHETFAMLEAAELPGLTAALMVQYVRFVADYWLRQLGFEALYEVKNPFPWMEMISMQGKANFFERHVCEYSKPASSAPAVLTMDF